MQVILRVLCLQFLFLVTIGALGGSVGGRDGEHLQCVECIQWGSDILLCIAQSCALTVRREHNIAVGCH